MTDKGDKGLGLEPDHTTDREKAWPSINHSVLPGINSSFHRIMYFQYKKSSDLAVDYMEQNVRSKF